MEARQQVRSLAFDRGAVMAVFNAFFPNGSGGSQGKLYFEVKAWVISQDLNANTSRIGWTAKAHQNAPSYSWCAYGDATARVVINGVAVFDGKWNGTGNWDFRGLGTWAEQPIASGELTVAHHADGSLNMPVGAYATDTQFPLGTANIGTQWVALPTIPRASDFTVNRTSVPTDGSSTVSVTIHRASSSFTHDVYFGVEGPGGWENRLHVLGAGDSATSAPIPKTWASLIPNATSGSMWVLVVTKNGGQEIGRRQKHITVTIPNTAEFRPTMVTGNARQQSPSLPPGSEVNLQGFTGWKFYISGSSGAYGSTIVRTEISGPDGAVNARKGSTSLTVAPLRTAGTQVYILRATDSRGRSTQTSVSVAVTAYAPPRISVGRADRSLSNGTLSDTGTYARVRGSSEYTSFTGNSHAVTAAYRAVGATSWSGETQVKSGTAAGSFAGTVGANTLNVDEAWEVRIRVADYLQASELILTLPKAKYLQSVDSVNGSVAFGGPANPASEFRVYSTMPVHLEGPMTHSGVDVRNLYGRGWTIYNPKQGALVTTDVAPEVSEMWTLEIYSNSYSEDPPGFTMLQGYSYGGTSAIIRTSGFTTLPPFNADVFFNDGRLCFWIPYMGFAQTHHFTLRGRNFDNRNVLSVVDLALPGARDRSVTIPVKSMYGPSAWTTCSVASGVTAASPVQVKRVGQVVFLRGQVHNNGAWPSAKHIATVPVGFRPSGVAAIPMSSDVGTYSGVVLSDGEIHLFANTNMGAWPTLGGSWPLD